MPNLYEILGLKVGAEPADVRPAFHTLAKGSHPDVNIGDATAEERFKKVNQAYEVLSDPDRRAAYDLGLQHKLTATHRLLRDAMVASSACFVVTVASGLYFSLPYIGREFARTHETIVIAENSSRPALQTNRDSLRGRSESSAEAAKPASEPPAEGRPSTSTADQPETTIAAPVPSSPTPVPKTEREQAPQLAAEPSVVERSASPTPEQPEQPEKANTAITTSRPAPSERVRIGAEKYEEELKKQKKEKEAEGKRKDEEDHNKGESERKRHHEEPFEAKRMAGQAKSEAEAAAARERERREEAAAETMRLEEGARLAFEAVQRAEAEAAEAARRKKEEDEEAAKKIKEAEEARAKALADADTKRKAEEEQKEQGRALCARAGHFHVKGMRELESGDVIGAREFFRLGADEGLWQSAEALAGTYDPEQLSKFNVLGLPPDIFAAKAWYEKARVLGERPLCEEGELKRILSLAADKPDADAALVLFRAAYTSGDGLAYVSTKGAQDERIYRYGDESRSASKKDASAYTLYSCNERYVFVLQNQEDRAALLKATVLKFGEPGFLELDAKYVSTCNNGDIRSAIPRK
jgi:curved DNA-binding protein CbpA